MEEQKNPNDWETGYLVFDFQEGQPAVVKLDNDVPELRFNRVCLISQTRDSCKELIKRLFPEELWNRFDAGEMPIDIRNSLAQLYERLNIEAVFDGTNVYKVKELKN